MTVSGPAGKPAGWRAADPAASPGIDGPEADGPDNGTPQTARQADVQTRPPDDVQELQQEIEQTRARLGETVEQLVAKTDLKARGRDKAAELAGRVKAKTRQARTEVAGRAAKVRDQRASKAKGIGQKVMSCGTEARQQLSGRLVAVGTPVWQATPEPLLQALAKGASNARQRRTPLAVAVGVLIFGYLAIRGTRKVTGVWPGEEGQRSEVAV
jgi:hypothetical protein